MSLDQDLRNLSGVPLLAELEPDARRLLAVSAETRILRTGDVVFHKGEKSDGGYVVLSGSIALSSAATADRFEKTVYPYTLIGEIALISPTERTMTAVAREPSAVLKISRALFHRILKQHPHSAIRIRAAIAKRLKAFSAEMEEARTSAFGEEVPNNHPRFTTTGT